MKRIVYLAGPVEYLGDTWREKAAVELESMGFEALNPLRGEMIKKVGKHLESNIPDSAIVARDRNDLFRTKLSGGFVLMSLNTTEDGRPPIGTIFELEWCYENSVPVLGILGKKCEPKYRTHPWVQETLSYEASSLTEALNFIENYLV